MPAYPDRCSSLWLDPILSDWSLSSGVDWSLRRPSPTPPSSSFVQLSDPRSLTHFRSPEISSPKPFVWFRAKTDKGIVCLADHLHSVTWVWILLVNGTEWEKIMDCNPTICKTKINIKVIQVEGEIIYYLLFWVVWVLCHINLWRLFNAKSVFIQMNSSISNNSV